jgi:hypothetical protein
VCVVVLEVLVELVGFLDEGELILFHLLQVGNVLADVRMRLDTNNAT